HDFVVMRVWAGLALVTALGPLCFWWVGRLRGEGGDAAPVVTSEGGVPRLSDGLGVSARDRQRAASSGQSGV
ncbi:hypothetical protein ACPCTO_24160, partial [Streptomyces olivoreticuli]